MSRNDRREDADMLARIDYDGRPADEPKPQAEPIIADWLYAWVEKKVRAKGLTMQAAWTAAGMTGDYELMTVSQYQTLIASLQ